MILKIKKLPKSEYDTYLKSESWKFKRNQFLEYFKVCNVCGTNNNLTVHHRHYKNLGYEGIFDVEVLCWKHHTEKHESMPGKYRDLKIHKDKVSILKQAGILR